MDHLANLKTAFKTSWKYKFLIVFGIILTLCSSSGGYSNSSNFNTENSSTSSNSYYNYQLDNGVNNNILENDLTTAESDIDNAVDEVSNFLDENVMLVVGLVLFGLIFMVLMILLFAYIANTAEAGMYLSADKLTTGGEASFGWGWKAGSKFWTRLFAFKFVIGLLVFLVFLVVAVPFVIAAIAFPFLLVFLCILIPILIVVTVLFAIIMKFSYMQIVLQGDSISGALRNGYELFKANKGDSIIYALVLFGVAFVVGMIVGLVSLFTILPATILGSAADAVEVFAGCAACITFLVFLPIMGYVKASLETYSVLTFRALSNPFATSIIEEVQETETKAE